MKIKAGRLAKLFKGKLPTRTKHAQLEILYLVQGIPCPHKEVPKLEPNTQVEVTTHDNLRPYAAEDPVRKG